MSALFRVAIVALAAGFGAFGAGPTFLVPGVISEGRATEITPGTDSQTPTPTVKPDVIWIATEDHVVTAMLKLAHVTKTDVVYDLGCGDGKIVIAAARDFGARGVGVEIDPGLVKVATAASKAAKVADRVTIINGNIFDPAIKISDATVVTLFLLQSLNERLRPRLQSELRPGTRIVSNAWHMGSSWPAERTEDVGNTTIYMWTIAKRQPLLQLRHEPVQ